MKRADRKSNARNQMSDRSLNYDILSAFMCHTYRTPVTGAKVKISIWRIAELKIQRRRRMEGRWKQGEVFIFLCFIFSSSLDFQKGKMGTIAGTEGMMTAKE